MGGGLTAKMAKSSNGLFFFEPSKYVHTCEAHVHTVCRLSNLSGKFVGKRNMALQHSAPKVLVGKAHLQYMIRVSIYSNRFMYA